MHPSKQGIRESPEFKLKFNLRVKDKNVLSCIPPDLHASCPAYVLAVYTVHHTPIFLAYILYCLDPEFSVLSPSCPASCPASLFEIVVKSDFFFTNYKLKTKFIVRHMKARVCEPP